MIVEHITGMMQHMAEHGEHIAECKCYAIKATTKAGAYIEGFIDACDCIRAYVMHYRLDKQPKKCYTRRKALRKK